MIKHLSIIVATVLVLAGCSATPGDDSQTGSVPRTGTSGPPPTGSWSAADDGNTDPRLNGLTMLDLEHRPVRRQRGHHDD